MPSFDTVCEPNMAEVRNAVDTSAKEIGTRFDFKGTSAKIELKDKEITMFGDAEFQLTQVEDILRNKLTKRNVDVRFLDIGKVEKIGGDKVKQVIKVKNGIETEDAEFLGVFHPEAALDEMHAGWNDHFTTAGFDGIINETLNLRLRERTGRRNGG